MAVARLLQEHRQGQLLPALQPLSIELKAAQL